VFRFHRDENTLPEDEREDLLANKKGDTVQEMDKKARRFTRLMAAVAVITLVVMAGTLGTVLAMSDNGVLDGGPDWAADKDKDATANAADNDGTSGDKKTTTDTNIVSVFDGAHIHNNDVQNDGDDTNDLNFGLSPEANKSADYYYKEFVQTLYDDPPFLAATALSLDAELGTNYLDQVQYVGGNEKTNWLDRANGANLILCPSKELTTRTAQAIEGYLDTVVVKKEVRSAKVAYDQIYMNPHTITGVPELVVYETEAENSTYLVLTCMLKNGEIHELWYHIPCRYQWSIPDAEKTIGVTPSKKSSSGGSNGNNPSPSPSPSPSPTPSKNVKDQSQRKAIGNDDKGPGEKTIGEDPNHSTKDRSDNSPSGSYQDYKNNQKNLEETNKNQKTGSDNNTPSTPAPSSQTTVDNNGDKGTGNGGINTPTPVQGGETVKGDPAAGTMDEPS
jgi:hypothetical protein